MRIVEAYQRTQSEETTKIVTFTANFDLDSNYIDFEHFTFQRYDFGKNSFFIASDF